MLCPPNVRSLNTFPQYSTIFGYCPPDVESKMPPEKMIDKRKCVVLIQNECGSESEKGQLILLRKVQMMVGGAKDDDDVL